MLEEILPGMTHLLTAWWILIDGHSSLLTKLLTQNALTARCLYHKILSSASDFQASRQPGNQLIQQRFAGCVGGNESLV